MKDLFIILIFSGIIASISYSKNYTQKDLESDLNYYYKIASQRKDLTTNDKLYILDRIYQKYKTTNLDLSKLTKEIETLKLQLEKEKSSKTTTSLSTSTAEALLKNPNIDEEKKEFKKIIEDEKYRISTGDILYISVFPTEELSTEVIVLPDGKISFPLIGKLKVEGLTIKELQNLLEKNLSVYISKPKVSIAIRYFAKKQVFIIGEVRNPGGYQYYDGLKLLEIISCAGGFTPDAGTKNIRIHRIKKGKQKTILVNFEEIMMDTSKDVLLEPADIIEVPKQLKSISVIGSVINPRNFEWQDDLDLLKALSLAGGPTDIANLTTIRIFRENPDGSREVIDINGKKLFKGELKYNKKLQPGDVIYVPKKPLVTGQWLVNTLLPWASLIISIFIIITYLK